MRVIHIFGSFFGLWLIKLSQCSPSLTLKKLDDLKNHPTWNYLPEKCGTSVFSDTRIIGGQAASLGQFPWMARIGYNVKDDKIMYLCAGSIINRWHILTAKHCLKDELLFSIAEVTVGENFLKNELDCEGSVCAPPPQNIEVKFVRLLKNYRSSDPAYGDIGIVKLAEPIIFNDFVQPICLPTIDMIKEMDKYLNIGSVVEIAGWGTIHPNLTKIPKQLMHIKLPVVDLRLCKQTFIRNYIDDTQICIGVGEGKDTCVGDSGGPVMKPIALNAPPKYFLLALVSYGTKSCGIKSAIYTKISYYIKWILDHIDNVI